MGGWGGSNMVNGGLADAGAAHGLHACLLHVTCAAHQQAACPWRSSRHLLTQHTPQHAAAPPPTWVRLLSNVPSPFENTKLIS